MEAIFIANKHYENMISQGKRNEKQLKENAHVRRNAKMLNAIIAERVDVLEKLRDTESKLPTICSKCLKHAK